ncbi:hypothetical protein FZEAL_2461 [Fusarium zealandicum]|uniref:DUF7730 domain-containing protein n=1 Tax=Fusarium zealandicum TaxID=1053134 RepID=A0A8H4UQP1_9HYPO|nr:hypothetical protein FZEAL_2461 [Fusarium zealandicum]
MQDMPRYPDAHPQNNSAFFAKLPPEIRHMVYVKLIGARMIHLRFRFVYTGLKEADCWSHFFCHGTTQECPQTPRDIRLLGAINFLVTCRQFFESGIQALYMTNTLVFEDQLVLLLFRNSKKPWFKLFRHMHFNISMRPMGVLHNQQLNNLRDMCAALACLPNNSNLSLRLCFGCMYIEAWAYRGVVEVLHEAADKFAARGIRVRLWMAESLIEL